jgi:hypothetical protein
LFAAGYSAYFLGALKYVAGQQKITLPATTSIEGSVGIGQVPTGFGIEVELKISVPGLSREQVEALVQKAHIVCPYSNATRGNIDVKVGGDVGAHHQRPVSAETIRSGKGVSLRSPPPPTPPDVRFRIRRFNVNYGLWGFP